MTTSRFHSELLKRHPHYPARVMKITTAHGEVLTPTFMPVGTKAMVNHLTTDDLITHGTQLMLGGNTYHMLCAPGLDVIRNSGGMHRFMGWPHPLLTDSGGFQVFSLAKNKKICTVDEEGAHCKHPITGQIIHLTPKTSIAAQKIIGADIIMAFDECTSAHSDYAAALAAMQRTHRWLRQSQEEHEKMSCSAYGFHQALFGIIQGGDFRELREQSAQYIVEMDMDGIALGGELIGFHMAKTADIIEEIRPLLPENKIRYTMGVGLHPQNLLDVVQRGIDIFDCVAPTRNARHGTLYHGALVPEGSWFRWDPQGEERGRLLIKKSQYAQDNRPITEGCLCFTCTHHTRAFLHYLFKNTPIQYAHLACIHNVYTMQHVCDAMRACIFAAAVECRPI
ncbi:MAG: tRNA-guanine(34) transglycosylase [Coxiella sp. RIFCSPHIGHO2_12_FULL_44_14]|nr:MAG: tRNA-guanine(34) transglycosylase [Coxiella sp. RIFCSPHIGHO2_12_FULL_44_14]